MDLQLGGFGIIVRYGLELTVAEGVQVVGLVWLTVFPARILQAVGYDVALHMRVVYVVTSRLHSPHVAPKQRRPSYLRRLYLLGTPVKMSRFPTHFSVARLEVCIQPMGSGWGVCRAGK